MAERTPISLTVIDRVVSYLSPIAGIKRIQGRMALDNIAAAGFTTPGSLKRSMRGWITRTRSADADINPKIKKSREGSRDLFMNTPLATAALRRARTNVIGVGLKFQSRPDRNYLKEKFGFSDEDLSKWERNVEREFDVWAKSKECDAEKTLNFYQLQSLAYFSALLSGDVFAALPYISNKRNSAYELTIRIIEADQISNPQGQADSPDTIGGVTIDENGAPKSYHIQKSHPGAIYGITFPDQHWIEVPIYGESGRINILHLFKKERPGQHRGVPFLAHVVEKLKSTSRLSESELTGALLASMFTVFVTKQTGGPLLQQGFTPALSPEAGGTVLNPAAVPGDEMNYEMGSGNIIGLGENEKIEIADAKRPNQAFEGFFNCMVKEFSAAIEMPYEHVMLHFTSSYSAARAQLLEVWKFYKGERCWVDTDFSQPVFEEWLTEAIIKGRIIAPGFFDDPSFRAAWCGSNWVGPGQGQIDPMKETQASIEKVKANLSTYEDEYASSTGGDWESAVDRRAREEALLKEKDLVSVMVKPEPTIPPGESANPAGKPGGNSASPNNKKA